MGVRTYPGVLKHYRCSSVTESMLCTNKTLGSISDEREREGGSREGEREKETT